MGYSPWGRKESDTTEQLSTYPLHASVYSSAECGSNGGTYWNRREHLAQSASVSGPCTHWE